MPQTQDEQWAGPSAGGTEGSGQGGDVGGPADEAGERQEADSTAGPAVGKAASFGRASLLEGLDELFTVNAMGLPKALSRCLCTTNLIESPHSGVRMRTRRVCNWQDGQMVLRWATAAFLETEKHFQRIGGYKQLWMLKSYLDELENEQTLAEKRKVG